MEKEKTPIEERKENELVSYIVVLRGLINYHKRMVLPLSSMQCRNDKGICPAIVFENDVYLATLEESLRLMERELNTKSF